MCSIMGYTARDIDLAKLREAFAATKSRGPDDSRELELPGGTLLFHRLAIMGLEPAGMQPFIASDGSAVVCNGELYGFRKLKKEMVEKGHVFASGSDCELLLPLWKEHGTEMFGELDAEFALVLYDAVSDSFVAARDPIGIRPLYYGYSESGHIIFASEPKSLLGLTDKIMPFPPGHYYKDGEFISYRNMTRVEKVCADDLETVCAIAAKLLGRPIETYAVGMSTDAIDLKYAKQVAEQFESICRAVLW